LWRRRDLGRAVELLRLACDGPEGPACTALGAMYEAGDGVERDPRRAVRLFERACSAYDSEGCARAGALHLGGGEGLPRDPALALPLLERGCREGIALGCAALAELYASGWDAAGTGRDMAKARFYARRACDRGDMAACGVLGHAGGGDTPGTNGG
jgi:TPR repeat protein